MNPLTISLGDLVHAMNWFARIMVFHECVVFIAIVCYIIVCFSNVQTNPFYVFDCYRHIDTKDALTLVDSQTSR